MPAQIHTIISLNCEWPGFSKSRSWSPRVGGIAFAIKSSGASIVLAQELGRDEASSLATRLGKGWTYHRAQGSQFGEGLNAVLWNTADWEQDGDEIDRNIPRYGQMQRTLLAVPLEHRNGEKVTAGSSHFANTKAIDLTIGPLAAQTAQAKAVDGFVGSRRRCILGIDSNNKTNLFGGRRYLTQHGWQITGNGIDIIATQPGVQVIRKWLVKIPSDHPNAIAATITTSTPSKELP